MITAGKIYAALDEWAPFDTQEDFDNSGLLIGGMDQPVSFCLLALDLTPEVCEEAKKRGAQMVITHHPVIFHPLKSLSPDDVAYQAVQAGLTVLSAHTNLDRAPGGVSDTLADLLGLSSADDLDGGDGFVKIGLLPQAVSGEELAGLVRERLGLSGLRLLDAGSPIRSVALCSGSGGSFLKEVLASEADAYITGDLKHDQAVEAAAAGLTLIDAGHYETESIILEPLREYLAERFPKVEFRRAMADRPLFRHR